MNLVVRVDGTVELDDRTASVVAAEVLQTTIWLTVNLTLEAQLIGRVMYLPGVAGARPANPWARVLVAELAQVHIAFVGTVIIADLTLEDAVRLLESLKQ